MPKETLKVKTKGRAIDDVDDGLVYKMKMEAKEGKKGEPGYRKWTLTLEEGTPHLYNAYEPDEMLRVSIDPAHKKLDTFPVQEDPSI